jgi:formylglycine-generating enzyme required for sulfatase activity
VRNALAIRHASFRGDMDKLVLGLKNLPGRVAVASSSPSPPDERSKSVKRGARRKDAAKEKAQQSDLGQQLAPEAEEKRRAEVDLSRLDAQQPRQLEKQAPDTEVPRQDGRVPVDAAIVHNANGNWLLPGAGKSEWFKDHEAGPEMVVVPAGSFTMGSPPSEPGRAEWRRTGPCDDQRAFRRW